MRQMRGWAGRRTGGVRWVGGGELPGDGGVDGRHDGEDTRGDDGAHTHAGEGEPTELLLQTGVTIHFGVVSDLSGQSGEPWDACQKERCV